MRTNPSMPCLPMGSRIHGTRVPEGDRQLNSIDEARVPMPTGDLTA